jgi:hypothetical protein
MALGDQSQCAIPDKEARGANSTPSLTLNLAYHFVSEGVEGKSSFLALACQRCLPTLMFQKDDFTLPFTWVSSTKYYSSVDLFMLESMILSSRRIGLNLDFTSLTMYMDLEN